MRREIDTGLPDLGQPFAWAVESAGTLYTAHGPVLPDGTILQGDIAAQTRLTLENLRTAVAAAGGTLDDVMQVTIYLIDAADTRAMDAEYRAFFTPPWPNRCTVVVAGLVAPGMRIELQATARLPPRG
ncbi:RidA family protein [Roseomonas sp. NAR14]|uniref:RidA family protein n=1 Tax=Roseomonas acroporae TaxID=2937791 RepID=A0A9X1Y859_9PROT|nr:RidA family protein [Roseomonas acroporae]MCK8785313.1 RidA family protein [Roseomonas acroporae]